MGPNVSCVMKCLLWTQPWQSTFIYTWHGKSIQYKEFLIFFNECIRTDTTKVDADKHIEFHIRKLPKKNSALILTSSKTCFDPHPPRFLDLLGHFSESPNFFFVGSFGTNLCILIHPIFWQKVSQNFWIWSNPPLSTKYSKKFGLKKVSHFLDCFGMERKLIFFPWIAFSE